MSEASINYFAYGSNLLYQRLKLSKYQSIKFKVASRLDNFALGFGFKSRTWGGAVATVHPSPGDCVWGVVWTIDRSELHILDDQEGVSNGIYEPIEVQVVTGSGCVLNCRTYSLLKVEPTDKKPSVHYLNVIIQGAIQCGLPQDYVEKLRLIEHNGFDKPLKIIEDLNQITDSP